MFQASLQMELAATNKKCLLLASRTPEGQYLLGSRISLPQLSFTLKGDTSLSLYFTLW